MTVTDEALFAGQQLSLDVGGETPTGATVGVSGRMRCGDLRMGAPVTVQVLDGAGDEIASSVAYVAGDEIASSVAYVAGVAFVEHRPANAEPWTERVHRLRFAGEE